jgi:hypothetical protein
LFDFSLPSENLFTDADWLDSLRRLRTPILDARQAAVPLVFQSLLIQRHPGDEKRDLQK